MPGKKSPGTFARVRARKSMNVQNMLPADSAGSAIWPMERKLFAAARARCAQAVLLDPNLSGAEKRVIGICLYTHMHPGEQWSCFASMATLAKEAEVCERDSKRFH